MSAMRVFAFGSALALAILAVGCGTDTAASSATVAAGHDRSTSTSKPSPRSKATPTSTAATFDEKAWRRQTIKLFGAERGFSDGTKLNYVKVARQLCAADDRPDYEEGSLQDHIEKTFCPHV